MRVRVGRGSHGGEGREMRSRLGVVGFAFIACMQASMMCIAHRAVGPVHFRMCVSCHVWATGAAGGGKGIVGGWAT